MLNKIQQAESTDRTRGRKKRLHVTGQKKLPGFLPAVNADIKVATIAGYPHQYSSFNPPEVKAFKAIRLTKHDLMIDQKDPTLNAITSPQDAIQQMRIHNNPSKKGSRRTSIDSADQMKQQNTSKKDFSSKGGDSKQKLPGRNALYKNNSRTRTLSGNSSQHRHDRKMRKTSTNLPQTSKVFIQQHQSSNHISGGSADSKRKRIDLSSHGHDADSINQEDEEEEEMGPLSFDQDNDESPQQLQSMFDPAVNNIMVSSEQQMNTQDNINFPMLKTQTSNQNTKPRFDGLAGSISLKPPKIEMMATKNSLFSKKSNSIVSQADKDMQDMKMAGTQLRVRQLFKPKDLATNLRADRRIHFKRIVDTKPASIFLRRTSSALMTKYSRKFASNLQVRAKMTKMTMDMNHNASLAMPKSPREQASERQHYDSIFTIGESQENGQSRPNKLCQSRSGSNGSGSHSDSKTRQPGYRHPTVAADSKLSKDVYRNQMKHAVEAMRLSQLKQSRLVRQNVNRVCEDLMQIDKVKNDFEIEQFGRKYLQKLYSLDGELPRASRNDVDKRFNLTMQSFNIGSQHRSIDSTQLESRFGAKKMSVQPTTKIASQLRQGQFSSLVTPFKPPNIGDKTVGQPNGGALTTFGARGYSHPSRPVPDHDYLMQEILQEHFDPSSGQIVVTLDGELGASFIEYLAQEEAAKKLLANKDEAGDSGTKLLDGGIQGVQKPILTSQSPRSRLLRNALPADKRAAQMCDKKLKEDAKFMQALPSYLPGNSTSTPPETAQDEDSFHTAVRQDVRLMLSSGQSSSRETGSEPYRQMVTNQVRSDLNSSIVSQDTNKIGQARFNTDIKGSIQDTDVDRAETEEVQKRKSKRSPRKPLHASPHQMTKMFDKKNVERAMEQQVEMFQSFGADGTKPPYKYDFEGNRISNKGRPPTDRQKPDAGSALRESFERKIVPLNAQTDVITGSLNTSRDDDTPGVDIVSSSQDQRTNRQLEVSTVGGGTIRLNGGIESMATNRKINHHDHSGANQIIHSPQIVNRKAALFRDTHEPTPPDITMTNFAIDKEYLEQKGSPGHVRVAHEKAPPDTQSPQHRGKGTKVLLQQAQMDPNSFMHTQPIHFNNYYVQARPLAKTIYGKQYKQAQEKLEQTKKKNKFIADQKAAASKQMASLAEEMRPITINYNNRVVNTPPDLGSQTLEAQSQPDSGRDLATLIAANDHIGTSKALMNVPSLRGESNSALAQYSKPYDIVDLKIPSEHGSTVQGQQKNPKDDGTLINLHNKDYHKTQTLKFEDLPKPQTTNNNNRLGTGGTLKECLPNEFQRGSQMSEKDTVMHLPLVGNNNADPNRLVQNQSIITEVQHKKSPMKGRMKSLQSRRAQKAQKMTVVPHVHMDELLLNGLPIQENDSLPAVNPLQTERIFAKFRGKSPIGSKQPNFLNRKKHKEKAALQHTLLTTDEYMRVMTENHREKSLETNNENGYNKALQVVPLRLRSSGELGPILPQQEPKDMSEQKIQVAFATQNGQLIGRAGFDLLTLVNRPNMKGKSPRDIQAALQVAQNFETNNTTHSYFMISSPQINTSHQIHTETSYQQFSAGMSPAVTQHMRTMNPNHVEKYSPSPISGDSSRNAILHISKGFNTSGAPPTGAITPNSQSRKASEAVKLPQQQSESVIGKRTNFSHSELNQTKADDEGTTNQPAIA